MEYRQLESPEELHRAQGKTTRVPNQLASRPSRSPLPAPSFSDEPYIRQPPRNSWVEAAASVLAVAVWSLVWLTVV